MDSGSGCSGPYLISYLSGAALVDLEKIPLMTIARPASIEHSPLFQLEADQEGPPHIVAC
jgi:hypothetical protein